MSKVSFQPQEMAHRSHAHHTQETNHADEEKPERKAGANVLASCENRSATFILVVSVGILCLAHK